MNPSALFIAVVILLPAFGLAGWGWFALARFEKNLREFSEFESAHFEIGRQAAEVSEGAR